MAIEMAPRIGIRSILLISNTKVPNGQAQLGFLERVDRQVGPQVEMP
jgi:hypothetical protein